jgi:hypothetical protein
MSKSRSRKFADFIRFVNFAPDGTPDIQGTANDAELNEQVTTLTAEKEALAESLTTLETTVSNLDPEPADNSITAIKLAVENNGVLGQFLSSDGDGTFTWADVAGGGYSASVFSNSGTWTKPEGCTKVSVLCIGAGGKGASCGRAGGGGGGSGSIAVKYNIDVSSVDTVAVAVGQGNGSASTASFGSFVSAAGGSNGNAADPRGSGGAGGTATTGDLNRNGSGGEGSWGDHRGGAGAASLFGSGGSRANPNQNGFAAPSSNLGAGGGGAGQYASGGNGARGVVIVQEFY